MVSSVVSENQSQKDRVSKLFVWSCFFVYILMMGSKNAYNAELVTIQDVFGKTKAEASLAMTYYFITYAIAQIVLSFFMGKINLRIYITVTAGISAILTVMIGYMSILEPIYLLCAVNGVLQAGIYSGCMQVIAKYLDKKMLPTANNIMSIGSPVASMISIGVPALCVEYGRWDLPFKVLGVLFLISVIVFFYAYTKIKKFPPVISDVKGEVIAKTDEKPFINLPTKSKMIGFFIFSAFISFLGYSLYYAIFNWVPSFFHEVFNTPQSFSILLTILIPIINAVMSVITVNMCEKYVNIISVSFWIMTLSLAFFLPMVFMYDFNIVVSLISLVAFIAISSGSRQVFMSIIAFKMRTQINSGSYLAFANAFAGLSAGVMPPIAGNLIDGAGYGALFLVLFIASFTYLLIIGVWSAYYRTKANAHKIK